MIYRLTALGFIAGGVLLGGQAVSPDASTPLVRSRPATYVAGQAIIQLRPALTRQIRAQGRKPIAYLKGQSSAFDALAHDLKIERMRPVAPGAADRSGRTAARLDDFYVVSFRHGLRPEKTAARLEGLSAIRTADPNVAYPAATPTYARSALPGRNEALGAMDIAAAHEQTRGDPAVRIALIDTGLDTTGTAGSLHLVEGRDLVDIDTAAWRERGYLLDPVEDYVHPGPLTLNRTGHGSILARTIAGPRGVCPRCSVMPLRAGFLARYPGNRDDSGTVVSRFEADDIAAALVHATNQEADIINLSLTVSEPTDVLALGINYAYRRGALLVGAAGNQGRRPLPYPAAYGHVVAVGAADEHGVRASFSNYGRGLEILAPGTDVRPDAFGFHRVRGTSLSAAYVSGIAGLIRSVQPGLSAIQVRAILQEATRLPPPPARSSPTPELGYGLIDARRALDGVDHLKMDQLPQTLE